MFSHVKNWELSKIGECLMIIRGISFPKSAKDINYKDGLIACLRTKNVQKELDWNDLWFVDSTFLKREEQIIKKGDILISVSNSLKLLGKVSLVKSVPYVSTLGAFIVNLRVSELLNNKFIFYYLSSLDFKNNVVENASTTTNISNISTGKLANIFIPIAPLNEQNRIVEKIEELFSDLDKATEDLKKTQEQLKIYRQAVLKAAFEGKLLERKYKCNFENLDELCIKITDGEHIKPNTMDKGVYFISAKDVRDNYINFDFPLYVSEEDAKKFWNRCNPERGNILIVSRGATVGRMCVIKTEKKFCLLGSVILLKIKKEYNNNFIYWMLNSPNIQIILLGLSGATAQQAIYLRDIKRVQIPIPIIEIQNQIVQEIESRLSVCDKLEETVQQSLNKIEYLRQSILKKAFEGKLVPQDPNDLPVCELLKQIKIEKDKMSKNGK